MDQQRARWVYSLDQEMERGRMLLERGIHAQRQWYVGESPRFLIMVDLAGGLERMLKMAWAMQVKQQAGSFPSGDEFRAAGHGLVGLVNRVADLYPAEFLAGYADARAAQDFLRGDAVFRHSLGILDGFARSGRYFHVDNLGGGAARADSPERAWDRLEILVGQELVPDDVERYRLLTDPADNSLYLRVREYLARTFEVFGCAMFRLFVLGLPDTEARQWSVAWQSFLTPGWPSGQPFGAGRIVSLRSS